jgi:peptidoglycan/LPS O-acetylase OafA/YrhL
MNYRSEIDGLRAIAVLSVIFFHADLAWFSGGFVGVDIFFVISGFLISSLIMNDLRLKHFEIKSFYLRRVRRLGPSLFVVLSSTLIAGFLLFDSGRFFELGKGLLSSVLFGSNWLFTLQANYFDAQSELNPLLHTWSLGIEEQFYLIWPLALITLYKLSRCNLKSVSGILIVLAVLSFSFNVWLTQKGNSEAAFFNTFGRIWELLVGAIVAGFVDRITLPTAMAKFLRIAGISALALSIYHYDGATLFPGVAALLPVLGTALILGVSQDKSDIVDRSLSLAPMVFVGKISYSLYLWHWPLLVFGHLIWPNLSLVGTFSILGIALFLSVLNLIEPYCLAR